MKNTQIGKRFNMWYRYSQQLQLPGMDVAQEPVKEKPKTERQPRQELLETQKPTPSLFYSDWSRGHSVPNQPVYHGTTHQFDQFDINKGTASNVFGPGFYFTSDQEDASKNYTGTGPDQLVNIDNLEYQLGEEDDQDEYYLWNLYGHDPRYEDYFLENGKPYNPNYLIRQIARDTVLGPNTPRVIPAHVRMKNPLHLTSENDAEHPEKTFIDDTNESLDFLNDNDVDESDNNSYKTAIFKLYNILLDYFESDTAYEICEDLIQYTTGSVDGTSSATMMMDRLKGILEFHDQDQGVIFKGEIFQRFVNSLGHDSIVMNPNEFFRMYSNNKPIKHYITWNPENIKHARENIEFDPRNPVITASVKKAQIEPESNEQWCERHKVQKEGDKYVFYHGSRINLQSLRAGSLLATSPQEAIDFGDTNYWNDRRASFKVYKVKVSPEEIHPGFWASLVSEHPVELYYKVSRKKGS